MPSSTPKWEETEAVPTWEESSPIGTQTITEPARKIATQQTIPSPFNYLTGPGFKQTQEQMGAFGREPLAEKWKTATTSVAPLPRFEVKQDDTFIKGLAKESANQLIGLPEFMFTTPAGIATAGVGPLAGKVGGTAIRLGYLADTIYNFLRQAPNDVEAFTKATPGEKGAMIARWMGTGALAGTLAAPEISRVEDAIKKAAPILPKAAAAAAEAIAEQPAAPAAQPEVTSASEIRSAEEVPEREVRAPVGEAPPLRQQGEPAPAGEAQAQAQEVGTYPIRFDTKLKHLVDAEGRLVDAEHKLIEPRPSPLPTGPATTTKPAPQPSAGGEPSTAEEFPPSTVQAKAQKPETPPISDLQEEIKGLEHSIDKLIGETAGAVVEEVTPEGKLKARAVPVDPEKVKLLEEMRTRLRAKDAELESALKKPQEPAPLSPEAQKPAAPAASEPEAAAKQPWQMKRRQWVDKVLSDRDSEIESLKSQRRLSITKQKRLDYLRSQMAYQVSLKNAEEGHRFQVQEAIKYGKPVPPEVLADYPDLASGAKTEGKAPAKHPFEIWVERANEKYPSAATSDYKAEWLKENRMARWAYKKGEPTRTRPIKGIPVSYKYTGEVQFAGERIPYEFLSSVKDVKRHAASSAWIAIEGRYYERAKGASGGVVAGGTRPSSVEQPPPSPVSPAEKPAETKAETAKPTTLPTESIASDWTSATSEPTELHAGLPIPKALQFANRKMSQLDEATTQHSGKVQKSFDEAKRAQREINKAVPSERRQNAISVWREAGGDVATLQSWASAAKGKMFKQAATDAQSLSPEEIAIANKAIAAFQVLETRGNRFDVLNSHRDNYVPHVWDVKPPGHGVGFGGGMLKQRFKFSKARTFNNFFEGDQAGFIPKTLAIGKLLPAYIHEMNRVIADRQLVADIVNRKGSDGRDLAVPTGNVTTVGDSGGKAVLVKPQVSRVPDTTDYRQIPNQPALSKWTWEGKDTEGNPVFVRADLALHPEAYRRINSIIGQSALRSWYHDPAPGLAQVPRAVLRGLDYAQSAMKREMFGLLAPFHQVQEGTHAIGHVVNPFYNIPKIDMRRPDMMDAANHGLMLLPDRTSARVYLEGVGTQSSLTSQAIRKAGPIGRAISDVIDGYQDYLFHQYIPGLKFKTYEALLGRNMKLYADELSAGTMTPSDVKITSAEQANAAYGHLNYALLDRNPTIQHIIQLAALAPDFLEARTRFAGQAVKGLTSKVGHEQFKAIAILAAVQAGSAFVLSNLLGATYDPKHPFEVIHKGRRYSMRSVPEDIYNLLKDRHQFIYSRVNPLTLKGPMQMLYGLNYRGEKVTALDTMEELLAGYIPITARSLPGIRSLTETSRQNPVSPLQQLAGSFGLRISRYSPISETYKRAGAWMDSQKIDRSKGSYPVSKYQQLRYALEDGDMDRAKGEYMALAKTMTPSKIDAGFRQSMRHPFTDSAAHDVQFAASLKGYDRQLYDQALRTRQQILNAFSALPNYR